MEQLISIRIAMAVLITFGYDVIAYPGGVPDSACVSMFPAGHSAKGQTTHPPYRITVAKKTYAPGETIKVIIEAKKTYFKGIYLQAHTTGCHVNRPQSIGVFTANDNELQTRHCFGIVHSTVSHNSNSAKRIKFVYWTAPVNPAGHVVFRATLVQDAATFWTDVVSEVLVDLQSIDTPSCLTSTVVPLLPPSSIDVTNANAPNGEKVVAYGTSCATHSNVQKVLILVFASFGLHFKE